MNIYVVIAHFQIYFNLTCLYKEIKKTVLKGTSYSDSYFSGRIRHFTIKT